MGLSLGNIFGEAGAVVGGIIGGVIGGSKGAAAGSKIGSSIGTAIGNFLSGGNGGNGGNGGGSSGGGGSGGGGSSGGGSSGGGGSGGGGSGGGDKDKKTFNKGSWSGGGANSGGASGNGEASWDSHKNYARVDLDAPLLKEIDHFLESIEHPLVQTVQKIAQFEVAIAGLLTDLGVDYLKVLLAGNDIDEANAKTLNSLKGILGIKDKDPKPVEPDLLGTIRDHILFASHTAQELLIVENPLFTPLITYNGEAFDMLINGQPANFVNRAARELTLAGIVAPGLVLPASFVSIFGSLIDKSRYSGIDVAVNTGTGFGDIFGPNPYNMFTVFGQIKAVIDTANDPDVARNIVNAPQNYMKALLDVEAGVENFLGLGRQAPSIDNTKITKTEDPMQKFTNDYYSVTMKESDLKDLKQKNIQDANELLRQAELMYSAGVAKENGKELPQLPFMPNVEFASAQNYYDIAAAMMDGANKNIDRALENNKQIDYQIKLLHETEDRLAAGY